MSQTKGQRSSAAVAERGAVLFAAALAVTGLGLYQAPSARAATYTWANSNVDGTPTTPLNWFNPTQGTWTGGTPVSGNTNTVQFFQDATTALTNTALPSAQTSVLDNGGSAFQLGTLTLGGKGSATAGANLTETISGDALNFSAATGTINLNGVNNTRTLTYNLNSNIQLGTASGSTVLTLAGNGSATFNIAGVISELQTGGGKLIKSGSSTVTLSGNNSYTGTTQVNAGALILAGANTGSSAITVSNTGTVLEIDSTTTVANTSGITLNAGAILKASGAYSTVTDWLGTGKITSGSAGVIALTGNSAESINMAGFANLSLGTMTTATYSGTLTPAGQTYRLGGGPNAVNLTVASVLADVNGLPTNLTVTGSPLVILNQPNTYTGVTTVSNGTGWPNSGFNVTTLADGGMASGIGKSGNAAANLVLNSGWLTYTGTTNASTDRLFTLGGGAAVISNTANGKWVNFTNTGAIAFVAPNVANTLNLAINSNCAGIVFGPQITDNGTSKTTVTTSGDGTYNHGIQLSNPNNSFTGMMSLGGEREVLTVSKLANGGSPSNIGASSSAAANFVLSDGSTLKYVGSGDSTDRNMKVKYDNTYGAKFTIDSSGTGALIMSGTQTYSGFTAGATNVNQGLVLTGTSASNLVNSYGGGALADLDASTKYSVTKNGTNTWSLGGTNTYTGPTTINAGTLLVNGSITSATAVKVGATLGGSGSTGAVTITGGTLAPGNSPGTLTMAALSMDAGTVLSYDLNATDHTTGSNINDYAIVNGDLTLDGTINLTSLTELTAGTYTLIHYSGALTDNGLAIGSNFGTSSSQQYAINSDLTDHNINLVVTAVPEPATLGLLGVAAIGLLGRRRRR